MYDIGLLAAERAPLYKSPANERPAWARIFSQIFDSEAPPAGDRARTASLQDVDIYAALQGIDALGGIEGFLEPR